MASAAAASVGGISWGVGRIETQQQSCKQSHGVSLAGGHNAGRKGVGRCLRWGAASSSAIHSDGAAAGALGSALLRARQPLRKRSHARSVGVASAAGGVERSYIMIKPDGVQRGLVGEIISRFERKGFTLKGLKLFQTPQELAEEHYGELKEKPFFPKLVKYIVSGPVVAMVWEGPGVVASARKLIGVTNPLNAEPGTIRGDFGVNTGRNVIHGSDSPENGEREIGLWFKEGEVVDWEPTLTPWILE